MWGQERKAVEGSPGSLGTFCFMIIISNIIVCVVMRIIIVDDRANLRELFEPFSKFKGCYEAPYVFLDDDKLTSWPDVALKI